VEGCLVCVSEDEGVVVWGCDRMQMMIVEEVRKKV